MSKSTADIYKALRNGADDAAVNEIIREMLSSKRYAATDHDVAVWRRDNYADLRRWAGPSTEAYTDAWAKVSQGGAVALEGEMALQTWAANKLAVDLRFPRSPFVPEQEPQPAPPPE